MSLIISHEHPEYRKARSLIGKDKWNGAYYYSIEICENIIPLVKTDRPWITINVKDRRLGRDRAIVFVHNHKQCPQTYDWLAGYKDLVFVCSEKADMPKLEYLGTPVFLPLSVDTGYVEQFRSKKIKDVAFAGRPERAREYRLPDGIDCFGHLPREEFLAELAKYRQIYAVDRVAIEAKVLGCEVLMPESVQDHWPVLDNKDAAKLLQEKLNEIDADQYSGNRI